MQRDELAAWLRLTLTRGVGDLAAQRLLSTFGLPDRIFSQSRASLRECLSDAQTEALLRPPADFDAALATTWAWLNEPTDHDIRRQVLCIADADYPPALLQMPDPPPLLYLQGGANHRLPPMDRCIAMVGSRHPTPQGLQNAEAFGQALASAGYCVVSGMALGIDGAAHTGALAAAPVDGMPATLALVGTGLDRVYPARHRTLAHRIAQHGMLLSELPLGAPPLQAHFPKRNRLIAALSRGTLVVEAALASGSLITARLAADMGREVFAIPGSIHAPQSRGCHALIRQGAKLVEQASDIFEEFAPGSMPTPACGSPLGQAAQQSSLDDGRMALLAPVARRVLDALGFDASSLDALVARTGDSTAALQASLLDLELDGWIARLPGGMYQRIAAG